MIYNRALLELPFDVFHVNLNVVNCSSGTRRVNARLYESQRRHRSRGHVYPVIFSTYHFYAIVNL